MLAHPRLLGIRRKGADHHVPSRDRRQFQAEAVNTEVARQPKSRGIPIAALVRSATRYSVMRANVHLPSVDASLEQADEVLAEASAFLELHFQRDESCQRTLQRARAELEQSRTLLHAREHTLPDAALPLATPKS
jgi:hypothetical protein